MAHDPHHLELARRHVAEADVRIARQRELLADMRARGWPTQLASELLASLMETALQMRAHYEFLRRQAED